MVQAYAFDDEASALRGTLDTMKALTRPHLPLLVLTLALLTGCTPAGPTTSDSPTAHDFDLLAAALPTAAQLPAGFAESNRCPGGDYCADAPDSDAASVSADGEADPAESTSEWVMSDSFWLSVTVHDDPLSAATALDEARDRAELRSGDSYVIEPEETESGFVPGEKGSGEVSDHKAGEWSGIEALTTVTYSAPAGFFDAPESNEPLDPRQNADVTLVSGSAVLVCNSTHLADADEMLARDECRAAITDYLERVDAIDPADVARVATPRRVAAALPTIEDFPDGSEISVRCPGDDPCSGEDQTQDASISVDIALPDGVESDGTDDWGRFRVSGGEWTEDSWLRVWIQPDEASAAESVASRTAEFREHTGELDIPPVATETGYDYGIRGTGEVLEIDGEGWTGALKLYDAQFLHLDGRITERVYVITVIAASGPVLVRVDSHLTVQGRSKQEAIDFITAQVDAYFTRLADSD